MENLSLLDVSIRNQAKTIGSYLIRSGDRNILIDCGPESQFNNLEQQLKKLSLSPQDITDVLLTHIHLDHAGAAWRFAELGANIYLHPIGQIHMIDPSRFLASAKMIYEDTMDIWGDLKPIAPNKLRVVEDNQVLKIGNLSIEALFTPGHAKHHISWMIDDHIFSGDICGCRFPNGGPVVAPTPPPDLDFILWEKSIKIIQQKKPKALCLTHYGIFTDVDAHLAKLREDLVFIEKFSKQLADKKIDLASIGQNTPPEIENALLAQTKVGELYDFYQVMAPTWMNVQGMIHYWNKKKYKEAQKKG
ncbi:MAG: MBL fold metallo-hydrolase [SAR324 cluster bacterium]|nr:MBL fold metallo-hydrolase [SAR324 cluster bacterium]